MTAETEDLAALREAIRDVLSTQADRAAVRKFINSTAAMDASLWAQGAELGWFGLNIPEDDGGLGLGVSALLVLFEELGRAVAPLPVLGTVLAAEAIVHGGNAAQRAGFLPRLAAGQRPAVFALPGLNANLLLSEHHILSGDISLVIDAATAQLAILPASGVGGDPVFCLLDLSQANVAVEPQKMADLTRQAATITVSDLRIDPSAILPVDAAAMANFAGLLLSADALGAAQGVFELTVDYMKTREQFGKPIGSFQALKHRAAEHHIALVGARALLAHTATLWETRHPDAAFHTALCKAHICEVALTVATDAVQLHGGIGFTWEHECHLFLKRIYLNNQLFGTTATFYDTAFDGLAESFSRAA
ncbi:MAG: acyl-CoA/acyl-ACP dehydrogenase [Acidocella sp.]|nr:acyl-CoA/acyl-ACP dehydrogenase [Acidocella sp.]